MKLFATYNRVNVLATVIIFLITCSAFYFTLHYVFINQIDEDLKIEEREINAYVKEHNILPEGISVKDQVIRFQPVNISARRYFSTVMIQESGEYEKEKYRQLVFTVKAGGQWYQAAVSKSLEETEDLNRSVLVITFLTILAILLATFIINRIVVKRIWRPFYQSLDLVKLFKVGEGEKLQLPNTGIDEFQVMNETLEKITRQARIDYVSLKTFSENASHEIQTPLAVIRSKLDLMIQDENLTEKQSEMVQAVYNSVQKLAKLNHSLLLLAKIENNQFHKKGFVDFKKEIEEKISDFQELWTANALKIDVHLENVVVEMNEELSEIMLNNLLSNATRYNNLSGEIKIILTKKYLSIANTGKAASLDNESLYRRFTKPSSASEQTGLGLSIVKQICDVSHFGINYTYENAIHTFTITWKDDKINQI